MDFETYLAKIKNNRFIPDPPADKIFVGGSIADFRQVGVDVLRSLINDSGVTPASKVLEIGSGIGRIALPLTQWLDSGNYAGVEIVKDGVDWCQKNITPAYANFQFLHYDIYNEFYNPKGKMKVGELPYPEKHFDVAFFCSVFTHLIFKDAEDYVKLVKKHLAPGGRLWGTWFIMDEEAQGLVRKGKTTLNFILRDAKTYHLDQEGKSTAAVAFKESVIHELLTANGFVVEHLFKGKWCERNVEYGGYQDLIVARLA